mmetsp:Transcript_30138/g.39695  ORF Transcript_30138/g.39695 Transcript_30138/m.39695 type:complete len:239 (-) Transcript_30138:688-1404(-)
MWSRPNSQGYLIWSPTGNGSTRLPLWQWRGVRCFWVRPHNSQLSHGGDRLSSNCRATVIAAETSADSVFVLPFQLFLCIVDEENGIPQTRVPSLRISTSYKVPLSEFGSAYDLIGDLSIGLQIVSEIECEFLLLQRLHPVALIPSASFSPVQFSCSLVCAWCHPPQVRRPGRCGSGATASPCPSTCPLPHHPRPPIAVKSETSLYPGDLPTGFFADRNLLASEFHMFPTLHRLAEPVS